MESKIEKQAKAIGIDTRSILKSNTDQAFENDKRVAKELQELDPGEYEYWKKVEEGLKPAQRIPRDLQELDPGEYEYWREVELAMEGHFN